MTWKPFLIAFLKASGILVSRTSMSLLKRFMMRPTGVDSKNFILQRKIDLSIVWCRFCEALMNIQRYRKSAKKTKIPIWNWIKERADFEFVDLLGKHNKGSITWSKSKQKINAVVVELVHFIRVPLILIAQVTEPQVADDLGNIAEQIHRKVDDN